jgi:hypothetical protein
MQLIMKEINYYSRQYDQDAKNDDVFAGIAVHTLANYKAF